MTARSNPVSGSERDLRWSDRAAICPSARERAQALGRSYAALDLGTNNCRLLIAEPAHFGFRVVDAFSRIVRLGEGLGHRQRPQRRRRSTAPSTPCASAGTRWTRKDVSRARLVATEACRLASNGPAFIERVREELGLTLEIVDRKTEAYLAVTGCASLADPRRGFGGGVRHRRRLDRDRLARRPGDQHAGRSVQAHPRLGFAARSAW